MCGNTVNLFSNNRFSLLIPIDLGRIEGRLIKILVKIGISFVFVINIPEIIHLLQAST